VTKQVFSYKTMIIKWILRSQCLWDWDFTLPKNSSDLCKQHLYCRRFLCVCLATALSKAGTCSTFCTKKGTFGKYICDRRSSCLFVYSCITTGRVTI